MDTTNNPTPENEWVLPAETASPAPETPEAPAPADSKARFGRAAKLAAPVVAALLVGGGAVFAVDHNSGSAANASGNNPAGLTGGPGSGTGGPSGGFGGGVAGEQHIQGTVTAKTATSVTVKSSSGTATYTVNATTQIVRNGQTATLADVKVGDPVFVHVYPSSSGQTMVERLFAGTSASDGGFGPPPGSGGSGSSGNSGTSTSGGSTT